MNDTEAFVLENFSRSATTRLSDWRRDLILPIESDCDCDRSPYQLRLAPGACRIRIARLGRDKIAGHIDCQNKIHLMQQIICPCATGACHCTTRPQPTRCVYVAIHDTHAPRPAVDQESPLDTIWLSLDQLEDFRYVFPSLPTVMRRWRVEFAF